MLTIATTTSNGAFDSIAVVMIVLGVVIIGAIMMVSVRGKIAARQANRPSARETIEQIRRHAARNASHALDADVADARHIDTAQQLMAQLDNKAERLEQLLAEADQRIEALTALKGDIAETTSSSAPPREPFQVETLPAEPPRDALTRSVYELADQGASPVEIAQQIDEQIGKVQLILALRRQQHTA